MKIKTLAKVLIVFLVCYTLFALFKNYNFNPHYEIGQKLDSLNGIYIYYNGGVDNVLERNLTIDGYNIGLKYQCVEFVKRYYYECLNHKMPDSYGHAVNFFDKDLKDGTKNTKRDLIQYSNSSFSKPQSNDIIVFDKTLFNPYGHVAIISKVKDKSIEVIQQNPGPFSSSREVFAMIRKGNKWKVEGNRVLGWLRIGK